MQIEFLQKKPFYIFKIENFLSDLEYQELERNFPSNENTTKISDQNQGNKQAFDNRDETYKDLNEKKNITIKLLEEKFNNRFFIDLFKRLRKEIFFSRLVNLTNFSNLKNLYSIIRRVKIVDKGEKKNFFERIFYSHFQRVFEFSYMNKGSFLLPHTDQKSKLISLMLYFPTKNLENLDIGTTFYKSRLKNFTNKKFPLFQKENNSSLEEDFEETITFPFKKKDLYCFIKSDVSWHAVKKLEIPENETRKSINVFLKI